MSLFLTLICYWKWYEKCHPWKYFGFSGNMHSNFSCCFFSSVFCIVQEGKSSQQLSFFLEFCSWILDFSGAGGVKKKTWRTSPSWAGLLIKGAASGTRAHEWTSERWWLWITKYLGKLKVRQTQHYIVVCLKEIGRRKNRFSQTN